MRNPTPQHGQNSSASLAHLAPAFFAKADPSRCCIHKTGPDTVRVRGLALAVQGAVMRIDDSAVVMPDELQPGTDYFIHICLDGWLVASSSALAPDGYEPDECRVLGGFHYSGLPPDTTVTSGGFATSGDGMHWSQADVDKLAGINAWSCWDQHWRPRSAPQGMAHVPAIHAWVDIYFCGQEPDWGTSLHGVTAASGAYLPKVPQGAGGNGSTSCSRFGWWEAAEVAASQGKRLLHEWEFNQAAFGVTEAQSLTGSDQLLITGFEPGYTSRYGLMQATGNRWTWGADHGQRDMGATAAAWGWRTNTLGRGSIYTETTTSDIRVLLGGNRSHGAHSGSRCASWSPYPWSSGWNIGLRAASDHVQPV